MSPSSRRGRLLFAASAAAACVAAALLLGVAQGETLRARTLTRTEDWVIVQGKELPRLLGTHKDKLRVYALKNGLLCPIPYQIDERRPDGAYCFDQGPPDRIVKDVDDGLVDDNDELVFMAKDAGDLAGPGSFPPGATGMHEIELKDPVTGLVAWVYVFRFDDPPPRSPKRYAWIETLADGTTVWHGERFLADNSKSTWNACRLTSLKFAQPGDKEPDYSKCTNMVDCSKVTLQIKKYFMTFHKDSSEFRVGIGGYINGPVRVVGQSLMEFYFAVGIWLKAKDSYVMLYPNACAMPTNVDNPIDISDTAGASYYKLLCDLSQRAKGWKFYNSRNPVPVDIDGHMDANELKLDKRWPDWNCVYGPEGAIINRFVLDPRAVRDSNELYYLDDLRVEDPPEFEPGAWGTFGYKLDLSGIKSGYYSGDYLIWYAAAPFALGDEKKFINVVDHPLVRTVH
jgi:hypothetical protein